MPGTTAETVAGFKKDLATVLNHKLAMVDEGRLEMTLQHHASLEGLAGYLRSHPESDDLRQEAREVRRRIGSALGGLGYEDLGGLISFFKTEVMHSSGRQE